MGLRLFLAVGIIMFAVVDWASLEDVRDYRESMLLSMIRKSRRGRAASRDSEDSQYQKEFQLNQHICPPVLCPNVDANGIAAEPVLVRKPGSLRSPGSDVRPIALKLQASSRPAVFPFFEGDIVLDEPLKSRIAASALQRQGETKDKTTNKRKQTSESNSRAESRAESRLKSRTREARARHRRAIVRPLARLWKYGTVPFVIDQGLNEEAQRYIRAAFRHFERKTCLRFKPKAKNDKDFLHYIEQPGCWSYVGRKGGEQFISIGSGCEHFGTIVHETSHALGFWHEQSRLDRDKYVTIVTENVSPSALKQFGVREESESTTRGFPYDYESIMHYGDRYFTKNGDVTIKLKKVGLNLKVKIGQRKHLSNLDIAQLNSMYYCNTKAKDIAACGEGWTRNANSCYNFVTNPKLHFAGAVDKCNKMGAKILQVKNAAEDKFIKVFLASHYDHISRWRTGGYLNKASKWVWHSGLSTRTYTMKYTAWAPGLPGNYKTMVYALDNKKNKQFVWKGDWFGTEAQLPKSAYPFICEKTAYVECVSKKTKGRDYRGTRDYTSHGATCQTWTSHYPHNHTVITGVKYTDVNLNGLGDHNFCRNPGGERKRPWCFTTILSQKWQYCDFKLC